MGRSRERFEVRAINELSRQCFYLAVLIGLGGAGKDPDVCWHRLILTGMCRNYGRFLVGCGMVREWTATPFFGE